MNRHVNAIAGRLSLRPPQRRSLEILDRITEVAPPKQVGSGAGHTLVVSSLNCLMGDFKSWHRGRTALEGVEHERW